MIYLVVLSALYALHLLLKLHRITTVVIGGFLLLRIAGARLLAVQKTAVRA